MPLCNAPTETFRRLRMRTGQFVGTTRAGGRVWTAKPLKFKEFV